MDFKRFVNSSKVLVRSRLQYIFIWSWAITVPCLIAGKGFPPLLPTFTAILAMIFISISVYIYNDLVDHTMDQINTVKNNRPLATGLVPVIDAKYLIYLTAVIGIAIGSTLNIQAFSFILLFYVLFAIYSWPPVHLKRRFLMKEMIIMSGNLINAIAACYAIAGEIVPSVMFMAGISAVACIVSQPALWDTTDIEADRVQGMKTLAMLLGWRTKMGLLFLGILGIMIVTPLVYSSLGFNSLLPIWILVGGLFTLSYLAPLYREYNEPRVLKSKKVIIAYWTIWQIFSVLAMFNIPFLP